MVNSFDYDKER